MADRTELLTILRRRLGGLFFEGEGTSDKHLAIINLIRLRALWEQAPKNDRDRLVQGLHDFVPSGVERTAASASDRARGTQAQWAANGERLEEGSEAETILALFGPSGEPPEEVSGATIGEGQGRGPVAGAVAAQHQRMVRESAQVDDIDLPSVWAHRSQEQRQAERVSFVRAQTDAGASRNEAEAAADATGRFDAPTVEGGQVGQLNPRVADRFGVGVDQASPQEASGGTGGQSREAMIQEMVAGGMPPELAEQAVAEMFGEDDNPLIGVPEGHTAFTGDDPARQQLPSYVRDRGFVPEGARHQAARYRESDSDMPFGWSTERIVRLQEMLVQAGLLEGDFASGWFDAATQAAWTQTLGFANQRALRWGEALDIRASEHRREREQGRAEALATFQPEPYLPPDPASLRGKARSSLLAIGRRFSDISDDELTQMASVMSGEYKRQHEQQQEAARRTFEAQVANEFADPGADPVSADLSGIEAVDPSARFDDWFARQYGGEIETRETSAEVARRGSTFEQGLAQMRGAVRSGGA